MYYQYSTKKETVLLVLFYLSTLPTVDASLLPMINSYWILLGSGLVFLVNFGSPKFLASWRMC